MQAEGLLHIAPDELRFHQHVNQGQVYETPFQGLVLNCWAYEPRALPWAGMSDAFGVSDSQVRISRWLGAIFTK
jgi:hypothetical protein